jgi:hypothetical protein
MSVSLTDGPPGKQGEELILLIQKREYVKAQMSTAWKDTPPDMLALEVLHYELKNLEYRIATLDHPA